MRVFVGIPLLETVALRLEDLAGQTGLERVVAAENMHVTLAFLDDQSDETVAELAMVLSGLDMPGFALRISGVDVFGGRRPKVVVASVAPEENLSKLRDAVRSAARAVGISLPRERYRPHATLIRLRKHISPTQRSRLDGFLGQADAFQVPPFPARSFAIYRSHLLKDGAQYEMLAEMPLRQP